MLHRSHVDHHWVLHTINTGMLQWHFIPPVILEAQRLMKNNTDVSGVPGGEDPPSRARYRPHFYPGSTLDVVMGHALAARSIPFGQISVAALVYQAQKEVS